MQRFRTSQFLESLIGNLFASYSGLSFLRPGCSTPTCRNNSSSSFQLTYRFPRWAFAAAIHVAAGLTMFGDPTATILVQRRVRDSEENGLMELRPQRWLWRIKTLLLKRVASPSDADSDHGHTALHVSSLVTAAESWEVWHAGTKWAVMFGKLETTKLLLSFGVNPDLEQDDGMYASCLLYPLQPSSPCGPCSLGTML